MKIKNYRLKMLISLVIILFVTPSPWSLANDQLFTKAQELFNHARKLYYNSETTPGELLIILEQCRNNLAKLDEGFEKYYWQSKVLFLKAEINRNSGIHKTAESDYLESLSLARKAGMYHRFSSDLFLLLGDIHFRLVSYRGVNFYGEQVYSYLKDALKLDQKNYAVYNSMAKILIYAPPEFRLGGHSKAVGLLEIALESKDPFDNFDSYYYLGVVYRKLNDEKRALDNLGKALQIFPGNIPVNQQISGLGGNQEELLVQHQLETFTEPTTPKYGEYSQLRDKWKKYLTGGELIDPTDPEVSAVINQINIDTEKYRQSMNQDRDRVCLWSDLSDFGTTGVITLNYQRLEVMTLALTVKGGKFENDVHLKKEIIAALDWLYQHKYNEKIIPYENLWNLEIGTPLALNNITVLLYDDLTSVQIENYMKAIKHFSPSVKIYAGGFATAANRVWKCMVLGLRGIIIEDSREIDAARDGLSIVFPYSEFGDG